MQSGFVEVTCTMSISGLIDAIATHPNCWKHHRIKDKRYLLEYIPIVYGIYWIDAYNNDRSEAYIEAQG